MYYLGIDLGSSSVKVGLVEKTSGKRVALVQQPKKEMAIEAPNKGWAEQSPEVWWSLVCAGIKEVLSNTGIAPKAIAGIGIAYQMHGLVIVDNHGEVLRNAIIWCDSRAVAIGNEAYETIGTESCDGNLLNSPGNFTASKLAWVKKNEPELFEKIDKLMLPGDYIAYRLSNQINTTISGLSEGIFWDFSQNQISQDVLDYFGFTKALLPDIVSNFTQQAKVSEKGAHESGLVAGIPICYRAGDQPNNALTLNVFNPGEVAATGGTSGVVYAVTDRLSTKESTRINNFAHVNYNGGDSKNIGKLLCINGAGIQYRWLLTNLSVNSYHEMNELANSVAVGSDGLVVIPFGNGAERMLDSKDTGTQFINLDLNRHSKAHLCRAALEGIAFAFVYGMKLMQNDGIDGKAIRAGNDNLFRSELFSTTIATLTNVNIDIFDTTGAIGAARACSLQKGGYNVFAEQVQNDYLMTFEPKPNKDGYEKAYQHWNEQLDFILNR